MAGSKSRGHFRKRPKDVIVIPEHHSEGRMHMEKEKQPSGPPAPPKPGAPPEGPRESPLGPGEHQDEPPADEKA